MRLLEVAGIALAVFVVVAQAFRIDKTNPPVSADLNAPGPVKEIMKRACIDGCSYLASASELSGEAENHELYRAIVPGVGGPAEGF